MGGWANVFKQKIGQKHWKFYSKMFLFLCDIFLGRVVVVVVAVVAAVRWWVRGKGLRWEGGEMKRKKLHIETLWQQFQKYIWKRKKKINRCFMFIFFFMLGKIFSFSFSEIYFFFLLRNTNKNSSIFFLSSS